MFKYTYLLSCPINDFERKLDEIAAASPKTVLGRVQFTESYSVVLKRKSDNYWELYYPSSRARVFIPPYKLTFTATEQGNDISIQGTIKMKPLVFPSIVVLILFFVFSNFDHLFLIYFIIASILLLLVQVPIFKKRLNSFFYPLQFDNRIE